MTGPSYVEAVKKKVDAARFRDSTHIATIEAAAYARRHMPELIKRLEEAEKALRDSDCSFWPVGHNGCGRCSAILTIRTFPSGWGSE